jgi:zinc protease
VSAGTSVRPAPGTPRPYRFPAFIRTTLDSGLELVACHLPGRRVGSARLVLSGGITCEDPAQAGVAQLAARALTEGTEARDAAEFAAAAERLGADISVDAGWDSLQASLVVPVSRLEPALDLLAEAVCRPTFPASQVARLQSERLNDIKQERAEPNQRAQLAFLEAVYTPASAYSRPAGGSAATVSRLQRDQIEAFYRSQATSKAATLILAGDLEDLPLQGLSERLFGSWDGPAPPTTVPEVQEAIQQTTVTLVDRPGSVQSAIIAGHMGAPRVIPDYFETTVMVTILGGLFTSRLNLKLREEKGYTYGVRSWFDFRRQAGPFGAGTAVASPVTVDALADILAEIRRVHDDGVTEEELVLAKDYLVGVFPLAFETPEAISQAIARAVIYGLPDDYYQTYRPNMQAVTVEGANRAAQERLHPDRMAIVVVGDGELAGPLEGAGFGPVSIVTDRDDAGEDPEAGGVDRG